MRLRDVCGYLSISGTMKKQAAEALHNALKQERNRIVSVEQIKFARSKQEEQAYEASQKYPRTLGDRTFFTPHLATRKPNHQISNIVSEYAVIVPVNGKPTVSFSMYDPTREVLAIMPDNLSPETVNQVHRLEKRGYRFNGTNKDILVFERIYNQKQSDRRWAKRWTVITSGSVVCLTTALFAGEVFAK